MARAIRSRIWTVALIGVTTLVAAGGTSAKSSSSSAGATADARSALETEVQAVRAATARYHSFLQAERDGYSIAGEPCVESPAGAMGIHAVNQALMSDDAIDPLQPEILLYLPRANGKLELIGVEYWKRDVDGNLATDDDRPSVLGQPFNGPMPGHNPTMPVHYDLHVWLWADNPSGVFAPFNPALACPG